MKRVEIFDMHLGVGGIEVAVVNLANMLSDAYNVTLVITYKLQDTPLYALNKKVKVEYLMDNDAASLGNKLKGNVIKNVFREYVCKGKLFTLIKDTYKAVFVLLNKKRVIQKYIQNSESDILISARMEITKIMNKYYKKKGITIFQEHGDHTKDKKYMQSLYKNTTNIDYIMPVSKYITGIYQTMLNKKVIYGPLAVDYISDKKNKLDNKNLISIGRFNPEKGFLDLIDIFKLVHEQDKDIKLHLIGNGYQYNEIKDKIESYHLKDDIILYGYLNKEEIREVLSKSSLYVMPSHEESFGLVLLESAGFGIPAIAFSSATGACEIIKDKVDGILVQERDNDRYAREVITILNNHKLLKNMGAKAYEKSQTYSFDRIKEVWLNIIKKLYIDSQNNLSRKRHF